MQKTSFRTALFLVLLIIGLLPLAGNVSVNLPEVLEKLSELQRSELIFKAEKKADSFALLLRRIEEDMRIIAQLPGARSLFSAPADRHAPPEVTEKQLPLLLDNWFRHKNLDAIALVDTRGQVGLTWLKNTESGKEKSDWFKEETDTGMVSLWLTEARTRRTGDVFVAALKSVEYTGKGSHRHIPQTLLIVPLFDNRNQFAGMVVGRFLLVGKRQAPLPFELLINGVGTVFYDSSAALHLDHPETELNNCPRKTILPRYPQLVKLGDQDKYLFVTESDSQSMLFWQVLPDQHREHSLWIGIRTSNSELEGWIHSFILHVVIFVSLFSGLAFLLAALITRKTDRARTILLERVSRLVRRGEPIRLDWKWPRELRELANELEQLSLSFLRQQQRLHKQNRFIRNIFDGIQDGVAVIDRDMTIIDVNRTLGEWRQDMQPLQGKPCHLIFRSRDSSCATCPAKKAMQTKTLQREEMLLPDTSGKNRWYEVSAYPLQNEQNEVTSVVQFFRDISEKKEAQKTRASLEQQLAFAQKMESIGTLAGGVAHDFNNMLSAINGYAELSLQRMEKNDPHYKAMQTILSSGKKAADLTRQLLAFSRKQVVHLTRMDINSEIEELYKMLSRLLGEHIEVKTRLAQGLWPIRADRTLLGQVLINLAVNARDAMEKGGTLIIETENISLEAEDETGRHDLPAGDYVRIRVSDTGHGISKEMLNHIFEPFFTTKEKDKGTGLGLATSYGIIRQHGGSIHVYSESGIGTVFTIYLPRDVRQESETRAEQQLSTTSTDQTKSTATILLVEDEPAVRSICRELLQESGYRIIEANNGEHGLDVYSKNRGAIDLILTDIIMPKMGGMELASQIREQDPGLPILFMSGYTGDTFIDAESLQQGVNFIHKPLTADELLSTIDLMLKQKHS